MKPISLLAAAALCPCAQAQWTEIAHVVPDLSQAERIASPVSDPSAQSGKDKWQVYYMNGLWYEEAIHPAGAGSLLIGASTNETDRRNQVGTNFTLSAADIADADKVRFSFDLNYFAKDNVDVIVTVPGSPWTVIEITPEFRGGIAPMNASTSAYVNFTMGLMHLGTGTYIPAVITDSRGVVIEAASYADAWRVMTESNDDLFSVSFEIGADILQHADQEYSFVLNVQMQLPWLIMGTTTDYYYLSNMKVEKLTAVDPIPEPAAGVMAIAGFALLTARRRRRA